ncbi:MAG: carboxypeptidase regulatory-like domain-containing protein [Rhodothermales bacterium]
MRKQTHRLFWATLLVWGSLCGKDVIAQNAIVRGYVYEAATSQPMQGATVSLQTASGGLQGTVSNGDGYFVLPRVAPGAYTLSVTFVGFAPYEEALSLAAGETVQRRVELDIQSGDLGELVVEDEAPAGVAAVSAGLETIQAAQLQRVPMPGVSGDLAAYLQTVPGVLTQGDRGGQFYIRGGAVDQNLALLDGIPLYLPFHILSFYSAFPEEIIDEAKVYTGGYGAKYATRMSSMVDVKTRAGQKQVMRGSVSVAPFLSGARVEGPLVKDKVSVLLSVRESLLEQIMPSLIGQRLPYRFGDRFGKIDVQFNANHQFSITALQTEDRGDIAGTKKSTSGDFEAEAVTDSASVGWTNQLIGGRYSFLSSGSPFSAEVRAGYSEMTNDFGPREDPSRVSGISSFDAGLDLAFYLTNGLQLRTGASYRASDLTFQLSGQFEGIASGETDLDELNTYVEASMGTRLVVEPGLNVYTLPSRGDTYLEPRLRITWQTPFLDRLRLNASAGQYHQAIVGLNDQRDLGNLFSAWTAVPEDAPMPRALHAIVGSSYAVNPQIAVAAEAFYKNYENLAVPVWTVFPQFQTELQAADGEAYGMDVRADFNGWVVEKEQNIVLDGYLSYSLSEVTYTTDAFTYNPAHDRRHQLNMVIRAQRGELSATAQFTYGSGLPFTKSSGFDVWLPLSPDTDVTNESGQTRILYNDPYSGRQPPYERLDLWVERQTTSNQYTITLRAGAVNVLNRTNLFYYDLFTLKRVDQLPVIPSVGFKVEWR